jgi:hypothetical protein
MGTAGMDSLPKSHDGRFVHPGHPPGQACRFPPFFSRFVNKDRFTKELHHIVIYNLWNSLKDNEIP